MKRQRPRRAPGEDAAGDANYSSPVPPSALGCQGIAAAAAARGEAVHDNDQCALDDALDDGAEAQLLLEAGARAVAEAEVRNATGPESARWKLAAEKEVQESFYAMGAVSKTTPQELAAVGGQSGVLPMKAV
jgi:hypothetical protein